MEVEKTQVGVGSAIFAFFLLIVAMKGYIMINTAPYYIRELRYVYSNPLLLISLPLSFGILMLYARVRMNTLSRGQCYILGSWVILSTFLIWTASKTSFGMRYVWGRVTTIDLYVWVSLLLLLNIVLCAFIIGFILLRNIQGKWRPAVTLSAALFASSFYVFLTEIAYMESLRLFVKEVSRGFILFLLSFPPALLIGLGINKYTKNPPLSYLISLALYILTRSWLPVIIVGLILSQALR